MLIFVNTIDLACSEGRIPTSSLSIGYSLLAKVFFCSWGLAVEEKQPLSDFAIDKKQFPLCLLAVDVTPAASVKTVHISKKRCSNCLLSRQGHCANSTSATVRAGEQGQDPSPTIDLPATASEHSVPSEKNGIPSQPGDDANAAVAFTPPQDTDFTPTLTTGVPSSPDNTPATLVKVLPAYIPSNFKWGEKDGETFVRSINAIYDEIVHWKQKNFKTPSGKAGRMFVQELTRLFTAYVESSMLESISLKAAMVMPTLLLQKPHQRSRLKELLTHL